MDQIKTGEFLKMLRKEKCLTQEKLAEKLNVSARTVSRWETGSNMPDISLLAEIADFYNISISELIDGERKSEEMKEEDKDVAGKMADYAENEKATIIRNIRNHSLLGVCSYAIMVILTLVVPAGYSRITDMIHLFSETFVYVSLIMIFLISTGLLYKIQNKQKEIHIPRLLWLLISALTAIAIPALIIAVKNLFS